ncbi:hypothetical protein V1286_004046 [Bradyrhizobium algeriense]|uniref:Uncharacterized protein n=1 Tax=Bradyrhizobium algeriense TaxID=634784 RepID=A0ABU8BD97_9BRAD
MSALRPALRHPRGVRLQQTVFAGEPNSPIVTDATYTSIRRFRSFALSKSEVALPKREVSGVRCAGMPSMSDVPSLRYVRGQPSFGAGTNVVPALLGRNPDELENSEDCGSAGGHGNQHVRLRGASIDASKRSARLRQLLVAAGRASCTIPSCMIPGSSPLPAARAGRGSCQSGRDPLVDGRRKAIRS